ncbi:MAG: CvpA family protein [Chloroflexi bacterium]|nr:CvpA family protein [Chloroflexota bacterium]
MILDIIVLAVLFISAVIAFLRGFIREVLTILGVVGGLVAAYFGGPVLQPITRGWFDTGTGDEPQKLFNLIPYDIVADAIAYGSIFIIVVIVLSVASHLLAGWAKAVGLGAVDRTLGVIFGLVRGVIIVSLLYMPVHVLIDKESRDGWFKDSKSYFYIVSTTDFLLALLPDSLKEKTDDAADKTADSMAKATREKLQELDVLKFDSAKPAATPDQPADKNGYKDQQRQDMQNLIKDNMND